MQVTQQPEREEWRIVVPRHGASEFLLSVSDTRFSLPKVEIPPRCRTAETLNAEIERSWELKVVSRFSLGSIPNGNDGSRCRYYVVEALRSAAPPPSGMAWEPLASLTEHAFKDTADFLAIRLALAPSTGSGREGIDGPFRKPGWFAELVEWTQSVIRPLGLHLTGDFKQFNASPTFSLVRLETSGPAVWFKAVGAPNLREFPITIALARSLPCYLPRLIATREDWNGWLAEEAEGVNLGDTGDIDLWLRAAVQLATFQIEFTKKANGVLQSSFRDARLHTLSQVVEPFFRFLAEVADQQIQANCSALGQPDLLSLEHEIKTTLIELRNLNFPDTIGHFDINPGNVVLSSERCTFLDWAEGFVGHPFFTFQYFLEYFRRAFPNDDLSAARMTEGYASQWSSRATISEIREALSLSALGAVFAYALNSVAWRGAQAARDKQVVNFAASLTKHMERKTGRIYQRANLGGCNESSAP